MYDFLTLRQNLKVRYQVTGTIQRLNFKDLFIVYVICCFDIRFNQMLFSFADNIIHEQIESVYFVYLESFC